MIVLGWGWRILLEARRRSLTRKADKMKEFLLGLPITLAWGISTFIWGMDGFFAFIVLVMVVCITFIAGTIIGDAIS